MVASFSVAPDSQVDLDKEKQGWKGLRPRTTDPMSWWFAYVFDVEPVYFKSVPVDIQNPQSRLSVDLQALLDLFERDTSGRHTMPATQDKPLYVFPPLAKENGIKSTIKVTKDRIEGDFDAAKMGGKDTNDPNVIKNQVITAMSMAMAALADPKMKEKGVVIDGNDSEAILLFIAAKQVGLKVDPKTEADIMQKIQANQELATKYQQGFRDNVPTYVQKINIAGASLPPHPKYPRGIDDPAAPANDTQNNADDDAEPEVDPAIAAGRSARDTFTTFLGGAMRGLGLLSDEQDAASTKAISVMAALRDAFKFGVLKKDDLPDFRGKPDYLGVVKFADKPENQKLLKRLEEGGDLRQFYVDAEERNLARKNMNGSDDTGDYEIPRIGNVHTALHGKPENIQPILAAQAAVRGADSIIRMISGETDPSIHEKRDFNIHDNDFDITKSAVELHKAISTFEGQQDAGTVISKEQEIDGKSIDQIMQETLATFDDVAQKFRDAGQEEAAQKAEIAKNYLKSVYDNDGEEPKMIHKPDAEAQADLTMTPERLDAWKSMLSQNPQVGRLPPDEELQQAFEGFDEDEKASIIEETDKFIEQEKKHGELLARTGLNNEQFPDVYQAIVDDYKADTPDYSTERLEKILEASGVEDVTADKAEAFGELMAMEGFLAEKEGSPKTYNLTEEDTVAQSAKFRDAGIQMSQSQGFIQHIASSLGEAYDPDTPDIQPDALKRTIEDAYQSAGIEREVSDSDIENIGNILINNNLLGEKNDDGSSPIIVPDDLKLQKILDKGQETPETLNIVESYIKENFDPYTLEFDDSFIDAAIDEADRKVRTPEQKAVILRALEAKEVVSKPDTDGTRKVTLGRQDVAQRKNSYREELLEKEGLSTRNLIDTHKAFIDAYDLDHADELKSIEEIKDAMKAGGIEAPTDAQATLIADILLKDKHLEAVEGQDGIYTISQKSGIRSQALLQKAGMDNLSFNATAIIVLTEREEGDRDVSLESVKEAMVKAEIEEPTDDKAIAFMVLLADRGYSAPLDEENNTTLYVKPDGRTRYDDAPSLDEAKPAAGKGKDKSKPTEKTDFEAAAGQDAEKLAGNFDRPLGNMLQANGALTEEEAEFSGEVQAAIWVVRDALYAEGNAKLELSDTQQEAMKGRDGGLDLFPLIRNNDLRNELLQQADQDGSKYAAAKADIDARKGVPNPEGQLSVPFIGQIHSGTNPNVNGDVIQGALIAQQAVRAADTLERALTGNADPSLHEKKYEFGRTSDRDSAELQAIVAIHKAASEFEAGLTNDLDVNAVKAAIHQAFDDAGEKFKDTAFADPLVDQLRAVRELEDARLKALPDAVGTTSPEDAPELEEDVPAAADDGEYDVTEDPEELAAFITAQYEDAQGPIANTAQLQSLLNSETPDNLAAILDKARTDKAEAALQKWSDHKLSRTFEEQSKVIEDAGFEVEQFKEWARFVVERDDEHVKRRHITEQFDVSAAEASKILQTMDELKITERAGNKGRKVIWNP